MTFMSDQLPARLVQLEEAAASAPGSKLRCAAKVARAHVAGLASANSHDLAGLLRLRYVAAWAERAWWALTVRPEVSKQGRSHTPLADELSDIVDHWLAAEAHRVGVAVCGDPLVACHSLALRELLCTALEGTLAVSPTPVMCAGFLRDGQVVVEILDYAGPAHRRWERALERALLEAVAHWTGAEVVHQHAWGRSTTTLTLPSHDATVLPFRPIGAAAAPGLEAIGKPPESASTLAPEPR